MYVCVYIKLICEPINDFQTCINRHLLISTFLNQNISIPPPRAFSDLPSSKLDSASFGQVQ